MIIPGVTAGQPFSLVLLTTGEDSEIIGIPQGLELDALVQLLKSRGVSVRVGQEAPAAWRRRLATSVAVSTAAVGLAALLGGAGFYLLRSGGRHAVALRPPMPEAPTPPTAMALPRDTPAPGRDTQGPAVAGRTPAPAPAAERPAAPPALPIPGMAVPVGPALRPDAGRSSVAAPPPLGPAPGGGMASAHVGTRPALPGAATAPGQPGDTELIGGPGGFPFRLTASTARPVLGFRYGLGDWAGQSALGTLDPLYEPQPASQNAVTARDGYAVGALRVDATTLVNAVQVVFMRLLPDRRLGPGDSYAADWIGRPSSRPPKVLGGQGQPVVGVQGRRGAVIDAIGLVLAPAP